MGFFNLFSKKSEENKSMTVALPVVEPEEAKGVVKSVETQSADKTVKPQTETNDMPLTVSYATGWPIDVVYGYLHKNFEQKGFEDAMVKSDMAFKEMNMNIIRNKILMVFREINLNYAVMEQNLQTRIDNCNAAGLLTTVAELNKSMKLINSHLEELKLLEEDFRNNANEASIPLQSYECGFLRGIATLSLGGTTASSVAMPTMLKNSVDVKAFASA